MATVISPRYGLRASGLIFGYGSRLVLRDLSFEISHSRFCALLGPNGAGKSSLFAVLAGDFIVPDTGTVVVCGSDIGSSRRMALQRMGLVFQQTTLDLDLTVRQNLTYYAALRGMAGREARHRIDEALERLDLADRAGVRARELNGGHRRRTEIARALLHDPAVLLLDEPTAGLDPASRSSIADHVHELCADKEITALWATHLVDEVRPGDDLVILHEGVVLAHDEASAIAGGRPLAEVFLAMTAQSV